MCYNGVMFWCSDVNGNPKKYLRTHFLFLNSRRVLYYLAQLYTRGFGFVRRCGDVMMSQNLAVWDANSKKNKNKLAKKTLTCDTDRTKARTPKCRPAFGCSRRALPGPNKKKSAATKFMIFASPGNRF